MRRRIVAAVAAVVSLAVGAMLIAPGASARWIIHNGTDATNGVLGPGGIDTQTCSDRVQARAGYADVVAPEDLDTFVVPDSAFSPKTYDIFRLPAGSSVAYSDFDPATGELFYVLDDGTRAPKLGRVTTPPRSLLDPPKRIEEFADPYHVFTEALIDLPVPAGTLGSADRVLLALVGEDPGITLTLDVVDCGPRPAHTARIDVQPGHDPNYVIPWLRFPFLAVAVYGDGALDVTKIASVKLGTARPFHLPPPYSAFEQPMDLDHDGRLDRIYFFVPADTGITCGQRSVKLTGRTDADLRFSGSGSIRTVFCR